MEDSMEIETSILKPYIYIPETNVVVVQNSIVDEDLSDPIFRRMESLMEECFKIQNMNAYFFQEGMETISLYTLNDNFATREPSDYQEFRRRVDLEPEYITSYAILVVNRSGGVVEVWNVCTSGKYRSLGYSSKILKSLDIMENYFPTEFGEKKFSSYWLCIDAKSENAIKLLKHYSKYGFENPALTSYTSDNVTKITNDYYVSMVKYTKSNELMYKRVFCYYDDYYIDNYLSNIIPYHTKSLVEIYENPNINVYLHLDSFRHIFTNYLGYSDINPTLPLLHNENSGSFIIGEYKSQKVLFIDHQSILQGNFESVPLNTYSNIVFHTHPRRAIEYYDLKTSWPSIQDFQTAVYKRNIIMVNMVFAAEGLYLYRISDKFKDFLSGQSVYDQYAIIQNYYVPHISQFEKKTFPSDDINRYIRSINTTLLSIGDDQVLPVQVKFIEKDFFFNTSEEISSVSISEIFS